MRFAAWPEDYVLKLFSGGPGESQAFNQDESKPFDGTLYALRFYDRKLSAAEVRANFDAKLANSPPRVYDVLATVAEDGEGETRGAVALRVVDVDDDPAWPNYRADAARADVYIASLPAQGQLLLEDGTLVNAVPAKVPRSASGGYTVLVRPPRDAFSGDGAFASVGFSYYAVDGVGGARSYETANVVVQVSAVNDAPVAVRLKMQLWFDP
jgi:hypothetical protein